MSLLRFGVLAAALVGVGMLVWRIAPAKSRLSLLKPEPHFPLVSGFNLNRVEFQFPRDFEGDLNLVIIPFQQVQQNTVNTWLPALQTIEEEVPGFIYYELPTIYEMPVLSRTFINEGMRAGIPDETARARTITLYLDKTTFKSALNITTENDISLFLVDRAGTILWRGSGAYSPEKADEIITVIEANQPGES